MIDSLWLSVSSPVLCSFNRNTLGGSSLQSYTTGRERASRAPLSAGQGLGNLGGLETLKGEQPARNKTTVDPMQLWSFLSPLSPITRSSPFPWHPGIRNPLHSRGAVAQGESHFANVQVLATVGRAMWRECNDFRSQKTMQFESLLAVKPQASPLATTAIAIFKMGV